MSLILPRRGIQGLNHRLSFSQETVYHHSITSGLITQNDDGQVRLRWLRLAAIQNLMGGNQANLLSIKGEVLAASRVSILSFENFKVR